MSNITLCKYKGFTITTRWSEVVTLATQMDWFKASFTVAPLDAGEDSWQQFPISQFATSEAASANAMRAAKSSIDQKWMRPALTHSAWMMDGANPSVEARLDLEAVGLYGADARCSDASADSNPYSGALPRVKAANPSRGLASRLRMDARMEQCGATATFVTLVPRSA